MSLFNLFGSVNHHDPQLGVFVRSGGYWTGECVLPPQGTFKLKLSGGRKVPDPISVGLARELPERFPALIKSIEEGLFEHYQPYRDTAVAEALSESSRSIPEINAAEDIWPHVTVLEVLIEPLQDVPTIEIAFDVAWDEEHTLGARIQHWKLLEICGSV